MIRSFEEVSIEIARVPVGRFSGNVEFAIQDSQVDVVCIWLNDERLEGQQVRIEPLSGSFTTSLLYTLLTSALLQRFAADLLKITSHAQRRVRPRLVTA